MLTLHIPGSRWTRLKSSLWRLRNRTARRVRQLQTCRRLEVVLALEFKSRMPEQQCPNELLVAMYVAQGMRALLTSVHVCASTTASDIKSVISTNIAHISLQIRELLVLDMVKLSHTIGYWLSEFSLKCVNSSWEGLSSL